MEASVEVWFCQELSKLGIDATEENAQYILAMDDAEDLKEYMLGLLDGSSPEVREFIPRLMERWHTLTGKPQSTEQVYRKGDGMPQVYVQATGKRKKDRNKNKGNNSNGSDQGSTATASESSAAAATASATNNSEASELSSSPAINGAAAPHEVSTIPNGQMAGGQHVGIGAKKKNKFVPLYSQQGKEKLVIQLPGRTQCECQALKHKLVNNCINCGRVVCVQEGAGPCLYCGRLVCTPEDQEVLSRGSKKSEKLRQHLMRDADKFTPLNQCGRDRELLPSVSARMQEGLEKAQKHKDKLIDYDKTSVRRTQVIDDECDYFSTDSNQWLHEKDREALRKREEELRASRHASRRDRKVTLDFAGRRVVEEANLAGQTMYDHRDAVVQKVQYGDNKERKVESVKVEEGSLINPHIVQQAPKFVPDKKTKMTSAKPASTTLSEGTKNKSRAPVIQDRELREMTDEGMCLSMHQPWASLLVAGIKVHEGRSWYTAHRGRLWIAATAKSPSSQEVSEMENFYQSYYRGHYLEFPEDYPVGCLLGCVDLVDCLSQEDYRQQYPEGESASPYVFICEYPQELIIKFPIKGQHKIYKLDSTLHQAAKKGLR